MTPLKQRSINPCNAFVCTRNNLSCSCHSSFTLFWFSRSPVCYQVVEGNCPVLGHTCLLATLMQTGNKMSAIFKPEMCSALLSSIKCSRSRKTWINHAWVELRGRRKLMSTLVSIAPFRCYLWCVQAPLVLQSQLGVELTGNYIHVLKSRRHCAVLWFGR